VTSSCLHLSTHLPVPPPPYTRTHTLTRAPPLQLFGHPSRGGLRITLYNGIPDEAVEHLVAFMQAFQVEKQEGQQL
jgi:hypothetical protein